MKTLSNSLRLQSLLFLSLLIGIVFLMPNLAFADEPDYGLTQQGNDLNTSAMEPVPGQESETGITEAGQIPGFTPSQGTTQSPASCQIPGAAPSTAPARHSFIPILMYHNFDPDPANSSSTTVTPDSFRSQLSYLKSLGYETITIKDLYSFLTQGSQLPKKPLLITIDDGYLSTYTYAYPILKELGMKATVFAVVAFREKTDLLYPHFNWEQAKEMTDSGVIEIQSHSYNLHFQVMDSSGIWVAGTKKLDGEGQPEYEERISEDFLKARQILREKLGVSVIAMAYPYGYFDPTIQKTVKETGYKLLLSTQEGVVYPGQKLQNLPRINVPANFTGTDIENTIQKLAKQGNTGSDYLRMDGEMIFQDLKVQNGATYAPLESFGTMQGLKIKNDEENGEISVANHEHTLQVLTQSPLESGLSLTLDGEKTDIPCFLTTDTLYYKETLYIAVRPFAEAMGYKVEWIPKWFGNLNLIDVQENEQQDEQEGELQVQQEDEQQVQQEDEMQVQQEDEQQGINTAGA